MVFDAAGKPLQAGDTVSVHQIDTVGVVQEITSGIEVPGQPDSRLRVVKILLGVGKAILPNGVVPNVYKLAAEAHPDAIPHEKTQVREA